MGGVHTARCALVDIAISTYRRPLGLERLLLSLERLEFGPPIPVPDIRVVVVDNDVNATARATVARYAAATQWTCAYFVEPERGISAARNRCLREARGSADLVLMVDDDEEVAPGWLCSHLVAHRRADAAIVTGPVTPRFEVEPPKWALDGGFFDRPTHRDGERIRYGRSGNASIKKAILDESGVTFDPRLGLIGGGDAVFFARLEERGYSIFWSEGAEVFEWQPQSRVKVAWVLRRAMRTAGSEWDVLLVHRTRATASVVAVLRGFVRLAAALAALPFALLGSSLMGRHVLIRVMRVGARGVGYLRAPLGWRFSEYSRTHGG